MKDTSRYQPRSLYWNGWKTSVRLEPEFWDALADVARQRGIKLGELASQIESTRQQDETLTTAIRVFLLTHYRAVAERCR